MKRQTLLQTLFADSQNTEATINNVVSKDQKFLKRAKRDIEDDIEEAEDALNERMKANEAIDKSTIEVMFKGIQDKKATLELYKKFEAEFYGKDSTNA